MRLLVWSRSVWREGRIGVVFLDLGVFSGVEVVNLSYVVFCLYVFVFVGVKF